MNFTHSGMQSGRQLTSNTQQIPLQNINTTTASSIQGQSAASNIIPQQLLQKIDLHSGGPSISIATTQQQQITSIKPISADQGLKMNEEKTGATQPMNPQTQPQLLQSQNHSNAHNLLQQHQLQQQQQQQQQNMRNMNMGAQHQQSQLQQQQVTNKNLIVQQMQKSPISQLTQHYQASIQNLPFQSLTQQHQQTKGNNFGSQIPQIFLQQQQQQKGNNFSTAAGGHQQIPPQQLQQQTTSHLNQPQLHFQTLQQQKQIHPQMKTTNKLGSPASIVANQMATMAQQKVQQPQLQQQSPQQIQQQQQPIQYPQQQLQKNVPSQILSQPTPQPLQSSMVSPPSTTSQNQLKPQTPTQSPIKVSSPSPSVSQNSQSATSVSTIPPSMATTPISNPINQSLPSSLTILKVSAPEQKASSEPEKKLLVPPLLKPPTPTSFSDIRPIRSSSLVSTPILTSQSKSTIRLATVLPRQRVNKSKPTVVQQIKTPVKAPLPTPVAPAPVPTKVESNKVETPKVEEFKKETSKPECTKPEPQKLEAPAAVAKNDKVVPEAVKVEETKPDQPKAENKTADSPKPKSENVVAETSKPEPEPLIAAEPIKNENEAAKVKSATLNDAEIKTTTEEIPQKEAVTEKTKPSQDAASTSTPSTAATPSTSTTTPRATKLTKTPSKQAALPSTSGSVDVKTKEKAKEKTGEKEKSDGSPKSKRARVKTQPYQSPLPELALIEKLSSSVNKPTADGKLIIFYKNEFLAVRNGEGSYYLCQAKQNVYKTSKKIDIRWLSEEEDLKTDESRVYKLDYVDKTDFECVLTTVELHKYRNKAAKKENKNDSYFELMKTESTRIENILKRALDVESGVELPTVTEENPDGLDLSLFTSESQLDKRQKDEDDDQDDEDYSVKKKKKVSPKPIKSVSKLSPKSRKVPKRAKSLIKYMETESSESDNENLLEISKKAKSQKQAAIPEPSRGKKRQGDKIPEPPKKVAKQSNLPSKVKVEPKKQATKPTQPEKDPIAIDSKKQNGKKGAATTSKSKDPLKVTPSKSELSKKVNGKQASTTTPTRATRSKK